MFYQANDNYSTTLRTTWTADPADTTLAVKAVPTNLPTLIVTGYGTSTEKKFAVTSYSGDSPSNYTLTGVTLLSGVSENVPVDTPVNCLNNEEFFNQYTDLASDVDFGWLPVSDTWTYASASTITVPSGAASLYQKGDKLRLKQGAGYKYYYIITVANALLTVTGGSNYTVASAAITDIAISRASNPFGLPGYFTFTSTVTGFSDTNTAAMRFTISGSVIRLLIPSISGTSNATSLTITVPVAPLISQYFWFRATDNGTSAASPGMVALSGGNTSANTYLTGVPNVFTASGTKVLGGVTYSYHF